MLYIISHNQDQDQQTRTRISQPGPGSQTAQPGSRIISRNPAEISRNAETYPRISRKQGDPAKCKRFSEMSG